MTTVKIYAIKNPLTDRVIYIGASIRPKERFAVHEHGGEWKRGTILHNHILAIKAAKLKPEFIILCEGEILNGRHMEQYYIEYYNANGHPLSQINKSYYPAEKVYAGELKYPSLS